MSSLLLQKNEKRHAVLVENPGQGCWILPGFVTIILVFLLEKVPNPTSEDIYHKTERLPMTKKERKNFFKENIQFLIPAILIYAVLTFLRDFRDNFNAELLAESHNYSGKNIAQYETLITLILLAGCDSETI